MFPTLREFPIITFNEQYCLVKTDKKMQDTLVNYIFADLAKPQTAINKIHFCYKKHFNKSNIKSRYCHYSISTKAFTTRVSKLNISYGFGSVILKIRVFSVFLSPRIIKVYGNSTSELSERRNFHCDENGEQIRRRGNGCT